MPANRTMAVGLAAAALVVVGLIVAFQTAPPVPPEPGSGLVISGRVTDATTGAPVPNACIALGPPINCFTKTNGDGRYVIDLGALAALPGSQWDPRAARA